MINRVQLLGHLGRDPEITNTRGGQAVAKLAIATTRKWTDKQTNQAQEKTEWHRVTVWGKQAELCGEYLHKGDKVLVDGRLEYSSFEKAGVKQYSTDIIAEHVTFLGDRRSGPPATGSRATRPAPYDPGDGYSDDGIPF